MDLKKAYEVMQAAWVKQHNVESGDKVRVIYAAKFEELGYGESCGWHSEMEFLLKSKDVLTLTDIKSLEMRVVSDSGYVAYCPFFSLDFVKKAKKPCVTVTKMVTVKDKVYSEDTVQLALEQYVKGD